METGTSGVTFLGGTDDGDTNSLDAEPEDILFEIIGDKPVGSGGGGANPLDAELGTTIFETTGNKVATTPAEGGGGTTNPGGGNVLLGGNGGNGASHFFGEGIVPTPSYTNIRLLIKGHLL